MNRVIRALIVAVLLAGPSFTAAAERDGSDPVSELRREVSELRAALLELTRRLEIIEQSLLVNPQRSSTPQGSSAPPHKGHHPQGRLLFPIEVERAMIGGSRAQELPQRRREVPPRSDAGRR